MLIAAFSAVFVPVIVPPVLRFPSAFKAPFLIVANEHVFLQYAWFYEAQDGNFPCPSGIECGMPSSWYPEYSKPLGPPQGPAVKNGYVWTREFAHASVYVCRMRQRRATLLGLTSRIF